MGVFTFGGDQRSYIALSRSCSVKRMAYVVISSFCFVNTARLFLQLPYVTGDKTVPDQRIFTNGQAINAMPASKITSRTGRDNGRFA